MKILFILLTLSISALAGDWRFAPDGTGGGRFYDLNGNYTGQFQSDGIGGGRFYRDDGNLCGRLQPDGIGGFHFFEEDE